MCRTIFPTILLALIAPCIVLIAPCIVFAQTPDTKKASSSDTDSLPWFEIEQVIGRSDVGDFVVGPGRTEIELQPGETAVRYITITNRISDERTFRLQIEDIAGSKNSDTVLRVIEGEKGPYSLRDYMSFQEETITLKLGERARVPVVISAPVNAEPGGYYGTVLVSTVRSSDSLDTQPQNPIIARGGSHFFITVPGEELESGELVDVSVLPTVWWHESGPINFALAYSNTGSVHVNPYGEIRITNILGSEIGYEELESWFVLPDSIRTREILWDRKFLFGRYSATVHLNRGYDNIVDTQSVVFWVLPWKFLVFAFCSLFLSVILVRLIGQKFEFRRKN